MFRRLALSILVFFTFSMGAMAEGVNKTELLNYIQATLPQTLCAKDQIFGKCFKISQSECISSASASLKKCISMYESNMPDVIISTEDAGKWGNTIGECTGTDFSLVHLDKIIPNCM